MEIVQLSVGRPGADRISLSAKLIDLDGGACRLAVVWPPGGEERHFDASDYYECLRAFRQVIEPEGFRVLCQGARPNVRPSGMSAQAGALLSYVHILGQPALTKDLVRTFDPVEDIALVSTVAEQDEWMARHSEAFSKRA
jgi:hypothetical protein